MTTDECAPSSSNIVFAPLWLLNTISVEQGDKVCVHSIKDHNFKGKALNVEAVLVTPNAVKDILYTGQENSTPAMISDVKLKQLIAKGVMRYSFLSIGQYVKVELEPPNVLSTSRPIILRIVSLQHDLPEDENI